MFVCSILLQVIYAAICIQVTRCNSAPGNDISADFPDNWCDKRYGTATRTTGECICRGQCEGIGCINLQGLSFYSFKACPTCKCNAPANPNSSAKISPSVDSVISSSIEVTNEEEEITAVRSERKLSGRAHYNNNFGEDSITDDETKWTPVEWLEENGRYIFAFCASMALLGFVVMLFFLQ